MSDLMEKLKAKRKAEGANESQKNMISLLSFLLKENRLDDLTRCTTNPEYLKKLLEELHQSE